MNDRCKITKQMRGTFDSTKHFRLRLQHGQHIDIETVVMWCRCCNGERVEILGKIKSRQTVHGGGDCKCHTGSPDMQGLLQLCGSHFHCGRSAHPRKSIPTGICNLRTIGIGHCKICTQNIVLHLQLLKCDIGFGKFRLRHGYVLDKNDMIKHINRQQW